MTREYEGTAVYRLFDANDELLYVGMANRPGERWGEHSTRPWWHEVIRTQIDWYDTREAAAAVEANAIRYEDPRYNEIQPDIDGTDLKGTRRGPRPKPRSAPPRRTVAVQIDAKIYSEVQRRAKADGITAPEAMRLLATRYAHGSIRV